MQRYALRHLADAVLLKEGAASARRESASTATLLAHIAEIDRRRLYADEGYDSMSAFCVGEWGLCEYAAYRRIDAARAALRFPALFDAVADGRLSLTTVNLLAPVLTEANAQASIAAAAGLTKRQLQDWLAERAAATDDSPASAPTRPADAHVLLAPALVAPNGASEEQAAVPPPAAAVPVIAPVAPAYPLHALLGRAEQEDLDYLKALLSHVVPSGELTRVLGRVFRAAIRELERQKFAVTSRTPRDSSHESTDPRHIPAAVRRAVVERDGGCCTFVAPDGHRCGSRKRLEFDHIEPVAKGGVSTVENLRLRCRTHNQHAAEQVFGAGFIERKRAEAREYARAKRRAASAADAERARREAHARELAANEAARARAEEVVPWLRTLGFRAGEARRAAEASGAALPDAPLEARVRHALRSLAPPCARKVPAPAGDAAACGAAAGG